MLGNPIECITNLSKKPEVQKVINTYCWISSSYTYEKKSDFRRHSLQENIDKIRVHSYYQWVPFMLFFQAITFYVPHWIWKMWEGGKLRMLTKNVHGYFSMDNAKDRHKKQNKLVSISTFINLEYLLK